MKNFIFCLFVIISSPYLSAQTNYRSFDYKLQQRILPGADGPWQNPGFVHHHCLKESFNHTTIPFDGRERFLADCAPEVLYSWQSEEMLKIFYKNSEKEGTLKIQRTFFWRTPMGTHGYGDAALRVKLRKDAQIVLIPFPLRQKAMSIYGWYGEDARKKTCQYWKKELQAPSKAVFALAHGTNANNDQRQIQEYILCDDEAIESWSFVTLEHMQEIQWELDEIFNRYASKLKPNYDSISMVYLDPWSFPSFDGLNWGQSLYISRMQHLKSLLNDAKLAQVFYAKDIKENRKAHFEVDTPSYYQRRTGIAVDAKKIISLEVWHRDVFDKSVSKQVADNCLQQTYCLWNAENLIKDEKLDESDGSIELLWNCENETETRSIKIRPKKPRYENVGDDLLAGIFQLSCL